MIGNLSEQDCLQLLSKNYLGRLACSDSDVPYITPISYVYNEGHIIAHSVIGKKIRIMRKNPHVCFLVDDIETYNNWRTVIIRGTYEEITGEMEQYHAMQVFVNKTMHLKISETAVPPELSEERVRPRAEGYIIPVVYRIVINEMTGRFERTE